MNVTHADLAVNPAFHLWRASNSWQRAVRRTLEPLDLTFVQFTVLGSIYFLGQEEPKVTQRQVARLAFLDENMTSQVVRLLTQKGLLARTPHPQDARSHCLALTQEGEKVTEQARKRIKALRDIIFGTMGERQEVLIDLLQMVSARAERVAEGSGSE